MMFLPEPSFFKRNITTDRVVFAEYVEPVLDLILH